MAVGGPPGIIHLAVSLIDGTRGPAEIAALDFWLFTTHGLSPAFHQVLNNPVDLLIVASLTIVSALFHECGHAAGCRYGGARPGRIGAGIYLVWPAFFTNVTDSYRLGRAGRLRTDLGGLYFNLIFMLVLAACYAATSAEILLLVIAFSHLEMLEQLLPFVRFDGYFILSDLVGLARRAVTTAVRWSAGRPKRRLLAFLAVAACAAPLALFWLFDGQLSDW